MSIPPADRVSLPAQVPTKAPPAQDAEEFRRLLNDQGFASHNRNENLHKIAGMVDERPADLAQAVSQLSDKDLAKFIDQIDQPGVLGTQGLSKGERTQLFDDLAGSLDPKQTERFGKLISEHGTGSEIEGFGESVSLKGSQEAKLAYIDALKGHVTEGNGLQLFGGPEANPEARSVGVVLGSLKGNGFDRAAAGLDDQQLQAVLSAASGEAHHQPLSGKGIAYQTSTSWETGPLTDILTAAATGSDAEQKVRIFQGGTEIYSHIRNPGDGSSFDNGSAEAPHLLDGMTDLLQSDTTGIVDRLNTEEQTGHSLSVYVRGMLEKGDTQDLGEMITKLTMGNDRSQSPVDFLNTQDVDVTGQPLYRNAENLGYFVGTIGGSIEEMNLDTKLASERIGDIYTAMSLSANQFVPAKNKAGKVALVVSIPVAKEIIRDHTTAIQEGRLGVLDGLVQLSRPVDPSTGEPVRLASDTAFAARAGFVASVG